MSEASRRRQLERPIPARQVFSRKFYITLLLLVVTAITLLFINHRRSARKIEEAAAIRQITSTFDNHHAAKAGIQDVWWMDQAPASTAEGFQMLERRKAEIADLLKKHRGILPETERITKRFEYLVPAILVDRKVKRIINKVAKTEPPPQAMAICFISGDFVKQENIFMPRWDTRRNAVMFPAMDIPVPLKVSILFHEFGHALRHNALDGKPPNRISTDAYASEEVEMNELGGTILNTFSGGTYYKRIDEVISRAVKGDQFYQVIALITSEDLRYVEELFKCRETSYPAQLLSTQFALEIGFRFCDVHRLGQKKKIEVYRWFEKNIFTPPE